MLSVVKPNTFTTGKLNSQPNLNPDSAFFPLLAISCSCVNGAKATELIEVRVLCENAHVDSQYGLYSHLNDITYFVFIMPYFVFAPSLSCELMLKEHTPYFTS